MPRPTNKMDLERLSQQKFHQLWQLVDSMSDTAKKTTFNFPDNATHKQAHWMRDKNLRDVLVHLYEWHLLLIHWIDNNQAGKATPFLPEPYTWKETAQLNLDFWNKHQNTNYKDAVNQLKQSHAEVMARIAGFSDEQLFSRQYFSWTGSTSLGSYCISSTSSHYDWAIKKLRKHQRLCQKSRDH